MNKRIPILFTGGIIMLLPLTFSTPSFLFVVMGLFGVTCSSLALCLMLNDLDSLYYESPIWPFHFMSVIYWAGTFFGFGLTTGGYAFASIFIPRHPPNVESLEKMKTVIFYLTVFNYASFGVVFFRFRYLRSVGRKMYS